MSRGRPRRLKIQGHAQMSWMQDRSPSQGYMRIEHAHHHSRDRISADPGNHAAKCLR